MSDTIVISSTTTALVVDNSTAGQSILSVSDATNAVAGLMTSTLFNDVTDATDLATNSKLVKRDATGGFATSKITGLATPTAATDAANKGYVDGLVTSAMRIKGNIDASTNPNYPAAVTGDAYNISVTGLIGGAAGESVQVGDLVLATADNAGGTDGTVGTSWIVIEGNLNPASETIAGYVRLATAAEVTAGSSTSSIPTIANVTSMVSASTGAKIFTQKLFAGSTSYTVNHALNGAVNTQVFDKVTGNVVGVDISRVDANNVTITVNNSLATDHSVVCNYAGVEVA